MMAERISSGRADELASHVETFVAIARFVDTCERPGPVVLTHRDIQPWNLLARDGRPVVLDWELPGMLDLAGELGSTALGFTRWNILRCLAGVEASTGPDLALSHESVHNGVRGLPDMYGRLEDLKALLV
jgi:aminoglycoside phosphotransferase (APT) family kinase protein